jgi:hypothetical protein
MGTARDLDALAASVASNGFHRADQLAAYTLAAHTVGDDHGRNPRERCIRAYDVPDVNCCQTNYVAVKLGHKNVLTGLSGHSRQSRHDLFCGRHVAKLPQQICNLLGIRRPRSAYLHAG